ncbi:MAG: HAD-IA family hydrolase [Desertimonas sp.]
MSDETRALPAAVLWDMDGTLVDTEPYWMACEHDLVTRYGGTWTDEDAHAIVGFDLLAAAEYMRSRTGIEVPARRIVDELLSGVIERCRAEVPWRPGARALLMALQRERVPCALVTMSWAPLARVIVDALGPGTFGAVVTGDEVTAGKPDPEPYRLAAHRLGVDPLECVALEDSPTGARSARDAGCVVVGIPAHVPIPAATTHAQVDTLVGVSPAQLGRLVATTPPPGHDVVTPSGPDRRGPTGRPPRVTTSRIGGVAIVAAVLIGALAWWLTRSDEAAEHHPGPLVVHTWVPYWTIEEASAELDARADLLHQISPFWYQATGVEAIQLDANAPVEATEQFVEDARDAGIPLIASILDATAAGTMAGILADPDQRSAHVATIRSFAADGEWDGIDIDYEQFAFADGRDTWATTSPNWVAFVEELAAALHADGRTLTVSIPPVYDDGQTSDSGFWVYDYGAITPHVDAIRIMAYDYSVAGSDPGPIAPLPWVDRIIAGTTAASGDPSKLILGIPMYGRNWPVSTTGECPDTAPGVEPVTNRVVDDLIARRSATPTQDPTFGEWTFTYDLEISDGGQTCVQTRTVWYVDDDGIQQRIQRAVDARLGGVALFAFGYDDAEVWNGVNAIAANLAALADTSGD